MRCCYGTRDAGAIWEDCYRTALEDMGFKSGASSPCVFYHAARSLSIVVHGDDFNALGVKADLDWYEGELAKSFEIKMRSRMGPGEDCTEIKILNKILRYNDDGLTYEADPRHIDLLASSKGLTTSNAVATPATKEPEAHYEATKTMECPGRPTTPVMALRANGNSSMHTVSLNDNLIEVHDVVPYGKVYGKHPSLIKFVRFASGMIGMNKCSANYDSFTCKSSRIMTKRYVTRRKGSTSSHWDRVKLVADANCQLQEVDGEVAMGESAPLVNATRTPPAKKTYGPKSRQGAKRVKSMERLASTGYEIAPEEATMFRALAARANFLAQDRPGVAFATKEPCRE